MWDTIPTPEYREKLAGAWLGRIAGCTLGACVEFFSIEDLQRMAKYSKMAYPPTDYWTVAMTAYRLRYGKDIFLNYTRPHMKYVPVDDDLTYTILDLLILEEYGVDFTTDDVGRAWLKYLPTACTAERAALDTLKKGVPGRRAALPDNPWIEWIGGDIRIDGWGYMAPAWPEKAAEFAYRETYVSHRYSGIYGGMYLAAAISAAFALNDTEAALHAGLAEIPRDCRTAQAVRWALAQKRRVRNWKQARQAVDDKFRPMSLVHTDNNLCLTIFGLLIGGRDFTKVIGETVAMGMDNDCTAASAGSIFGAAYGKAAIPDKWYRRFHDKQRTYINGHEWLKIGQTLKRFEACAKKVFA
jgi:ADP-ribosylglycohydrolase